MINTETSIPLTDLARVRLEEIVEMVTGPKPMKRCEHMTSPGAGYICFVDAPFDGIMCAECAQRHYFEDDKHFFTCDRCHLLKPLDLKMTDPDGVIQMLVPPCIEWVRDECCEHWQGHLTVYGLWSLCRACSNLTTGAASN